MQNDAGTSVGEWHTIDTGGSASVPETLTPPRGIKRVEARLRALRAEAFCYVANDVHPDDLRQLCAAILVDLSAGQPPHTVYGDIREDARWWAGAATPVELQEYLSEALRALGKSALCLRHRKALFANLWESFPISDRRAFLARVDPDGKFRRGRPNDG